MRNTQRGHWVRLLLACIVVLSGHAYAQLPETHRTIGQLEDQRIILTAELEQFQKALKMVHTDDTPPEQSPNAAVRTLAMGAADLKQQLIEVTGQVANATDDSLTLARAGSRPEDAIESEQLVEQNIDNSLENEARSVERLHKLLQSDYVELQESASILATSEDIAGRERAQHDAENLNKSPFNGNKVRLSGSEGSAALARISQRLEDSGIPQSHRDIAPICNIKTRLFNTLVSVENRSLKPVGKNHYIVRVRLQPGETTISILSDQWEVYLPQNGSAQDFLITLYRPVGGKTELHVFAIDDLLATGAPHIPVWLSEELNIKTQAG